MCCCKNWTARYNSKAESLLTEPTLLIGQNIERPDHINSSQEYLQHSLSERRGVVQTQTIQQSHKQAKIFLMQIILPGIFSLIYIST